MIRRLQKLIGRSIESPAGCGFLSAREVEKLLEGELSPKRLEAFRQHKSADCAECALLAADLEVFHGVATRGIIESERRQFAGTEAILKAQLRQKLEQIDAERAPRARFSWNYVLGAATAAMLLAVVAVPIFRGGTQIESVAKLNLPGGSTYEVPSMPFTDRQALRDVIRLADLWKLAGDSYKIDDFAAAEPLFSKIVERMPEDDEAALYHGICLVKIGRYDDARRVLARAAELQVEPSAATEFYSGVAAWGLGDTEGAISALERARAEIEFGNRYSKQADALLHQIRGRVAGSDYWPTISVNGAQ